MLLLSFSKYARMHTSLVHLPHVHVVHLGVVKEFCSNGSDVSSGVPGLQDVQPHLQVLDRKLFAVENVAGRHMAVDEMADMLGVAVPVVSVGWAPACWMCVWSGQYAGVHVLV